EEEEDGWIVGVLEAGRTGEPKDAKKSEAVETKEETEVGEEEPEGLARPEFLMAGIERVVGA
ncbi:hypothetical protein HK101_005898, partial [Irineochytrium annulatum]